MPFYIPFSFFRHLGSPFNSNFKIFSSENKFFFSFSSFFIISLFSFPLPFLSPPFNKYQIPLLTLCSSQNTPPLKKPLEPESFHGFITSYFAYRLLRNTVLWILSNDCETPVIILSNLLTTESLSTTHRSTTL